MIIAVFRQRSETISFFDALKRQNIEARVVNTPRQARTGCGISVSFPRADFERAKDVLASMNSYSFVGYYNY